MRVIHVSAYYAPAFVYGGPPRSIHGLCRALRRGGVDLQVFTTDANGAGSLPEQVTMTHAYDGVPVRYHPRTWPLEPIGSRPLTAALRAALGDVDLVHIHGLWNRVVWAAARECTRAGVPYVVSPRGMLEERAVAHHRWRKHLAFAVVERRTIEHAALLHATSDREAATLREWCRDVPVVTIPNGIDLPRHDADAGAVRGPVPDGRAVILFVGRLHAIKRLDLLLDAFARLHARRPETHLVIAGPDEQGLRAGLERRHASLHDAVSWTGAVNEERRRVLTRAARALVLCSDSESFGMSVIEALAEGTPAVVTDTCGWDALTPHEAGVVVPQSPDAIATALERLVDDPQLARAMGARGRRLVESGFTWDAVAAAMTNEYERVRERSRAVVRC